MCESCKSFSASCNTLPLQSPYFCYIIRHRTYKLSEGKHMGYPLTKESWTEQKMKLKTKFASLTDSDLMYSDGKIVEMMMKQQLKLGKTKEELQDIPAGL